MSASEAPLNLIVDTDVGSDDLLAISFLLSRPDIKIEAFTVANGLAHVPAGAEILLRLEGAAGTLIPVYLGRESPLRGDVHFPKAWRQQSDTQPGVELPPPISRPQQESAVDFLKKRLADTSKPVTILALGPLTNLGQLFQESPASTAAVRQLIIMGGAVGVPGNAPENAKSPVAEWNIYVDPYAAQLVFQAGMQPLLVPLNATNTVPIGEDFVKQFRAQAHTRLGTIVDEVLAGDQPYIHQHSFYAWDPLAAVAVAEPSVVTHSPMYLEVIQQAGPTLGETAAIPGQQPNLEVSTSASADIFRQTFLAAFSR
ncbi:MAG TPA: nucleoside hydrolase [Bryobacteraceae bacterium]|nr:nucleoside hydrolase [Bryobacteraceae bacterium]